MTKKVEKNKKSTKKNKIVFWIENIVEILIVVVCIVFSIFMISNPGGLKEDFHKTNISYMPVLSESMSGTFEKGDLIFGKKLEKGEDGKYPILDIGTVAIFAVPGDDLYYINTHRIVGYFYSYQNEKGDLFNGVSEMLLSEKVTNAQTAYNHAEELGWLNFKILGYVTRGDNLSIYYKDGVVGGELLNPQNTYVVDSGHVEVDEIIGTWNGKKISKLGGVITWVKQPLNFFLVIMIPLILLFAYNIFILVKYIIEVKTAKARKLALEEARASVPSLSAEEEEEIKRKAVEEYMKKMGIDPNSLPKNDDSSNDDKVEEKADVVEPVSDDKVVDEKPVAKKKTTKKSTTGTKKTTKSSKKDDSKKSN